MSASSAHPETPPIRTRWWCPQCCAHHVDTADSLTVPDTAKPPPHTYQCSVCGFAWSPAAADVADVGSPRTSDVLPAGALFNYAGELGDVAHPAIARLLAGWLRQALEYSTEAQRLKDTNATEAGEYSTRAETLAFSSQALLTLLRDVSFFAGATPLSLTGYAEILKIIRYGVAGDRQRTIAHVYLLADKVAAAGDTETAATLRRYAAGDFGTEVRHEARRDS